MTQHRSIHALSWVRGKPSCFCSPRAVPIRKPMTPPRLPERTPSHPRPQRVHRRPRRRRPKRRAPARSPSSSGRARQPLEEGRYAGWGIGGSWRYEVDVPDDWWVLAGTFFTLRPTAHGMFFIARVPKNRTELPVHPCRDHSLWLVGPTVDDLAVPSRASPCGGSARRDRSPWGRAGDLPRDRATCPRRPCRLR